MIIGNGFLQIELHVAYLNTKKGVMMLKKIPNSKQDRKVGLDFPMLSYLHHWLTNKKIQFQYIKAEL